jgi:hypothetical protein
VTWVLGGLLVLAVIMALETKPKKPKPDLETKPSHGDERFRYGAPKGMKRTTKNRQTLTEDEEAFVLARIKMELPCCPDCESGYFLEGPSGGGSINVKCDNKNCGSKFNLMVPLCIDRISDPSPDKPKEMVSLGEYR